MHTDRQKKLIFERFGRTFFMLFSRATMYTTSHPFTVQALDDFDKAMNKTLDLVNPLVLIMNREQFFIEDEFFDARLNTDRMVTHFKKAKIESISFEKGVKHAELARFLSILVNLQKYPRADDMIASLKANDVNGIKINHVVFRKMTREDEVVSRDSLKEGRQGEGNSIQQKTSKKFIDLVLEDLLMEEFEKDLSIENLLENPAAVSGAMIEADRIVVEKSSAPDRAHGPLLVHHLERIQEEVQKAAGGGEGVNLYDLAIAVYEMKRELLHGIEEQKAMGIIYQDQKLIEGRANDLTDQVLVQLITEEYRSGKTSLPRLAQIIRRMIPEADELKRAMPKLKEALLAAGMPLSDFLILIQELGKELQSDELARALKASAEEMGLDGEVLIREFKQNPKAAAELIYLSAEIRRGAGDQEVLSDLLVDYIERIGSGLCVDLMREEGNADDGWLREIITRVQTEMVDHLRTKAIDPHVLTKVENRLNQRIDAIFDKLKLDLGPQRSDFSETTAGEIKSTLKVLEESVREGEPLHRILKNVRNKFENRGLDENDLNEILSEILKARSVLERMNEKRDVPKNVLNAQNSLYILENEIARSMRYGTPFSMMGFALVRAVPQQKGGARKINQDDVIDAILAKLTASVRDTDTVGYLGKNKMIALMPMTHAKDARRALQRNLKVLHDDEYQVDGMPFKVKIAGVAYDFDENRTPTVKDFVKKFSTELFDMVVRLRNIQDMM